MRGLRELALVLLGSAALTSALTFPLILHPASLAYEPNNGDGQFSVWVVNWVARTLVTDPRHVFDANIFYPHRRTLLYSEPNLAAGAIAAPIYWATLRPYAAHNVVLLLSFVLTFTSTYYLVRHLARHRAAAVVAAVTFAFSPYAFAHLLHIHLLMTAALPLGLLAFHRLADHPTMGRGAALGLAVAAQGYACGYYAVFLGLTIAYVALLTAVLRPLWRDRAYWAALGVSVAAAAAAMLPLLIPFVLLQQEIGISRSLDASRLFAANWHAYLGSAKLFHGWMRGFAVRGQEVLFPGFILLGFGCAGAVVGWRAGGRRREVVALYGSLAGLALWASLGPAAGLYRLLYATVPTFSLLRAPSRFGLLVLLALSALSGFAVSAVAARARGAAIVGAVLAMTILESYAPLRFAAVPAVDPAYRLLATLPDGAVLELPVYSRPLGFIRARYMAGSTAHWKPLVDAYSDFIPADFLLRADMLGQFPSRDSLQDAVRTPFRYAIFHVDKYQDDARRALTGRLLEFAPYVRRLYGDDSTLLYEVIGRPP